VRDDQGRNYPSEALSIYNMERFKIYNICEGGVIIV